MHIVGAIKRILETVVVLFILCIATLNIFSSPTGQGLFGYKGYTVISASMEPTLQVGDYIIIKNVPYKQIKNQDIISFLDSGMIVTHRVVAKEGESASTRGDNNSVNDVKTVTKSNYVGTYLFRIPHLGYILLWLQKPIVLAAVMGLIVLRMLTLIFFKK